jgi:hypothetical protein
MSEPDSIRVDQDTEVKETTKEVDGEKQVLLSMGFEEYLLDESKAKAMGEALLEIAE